MRKTKRNPDKLAVAASQKVKEKEYWLKKLAGDPGKSVFPYDQKKEDQREAAWKCANFAWKGELVSRLKKLTGQSDVRLYMVLVAGVAVLLAKYSNNDVILMGTPVFNSEKDNKTGEMETDLLNTIIPLRIRVNKAPVFKDLLLQVRETVIEAAENQAYPIDILVKQLHQQEVGNNDFSLFDVVVLLENIQDNHWVHHTQPNVIFAFNSTGTCIDGRIEYNALRYEEETPRRISCHLNQLLEKVLVNFDTPIAAIDILNPQERQQLLFEFNDTAVDFPDDKTIVELWEEQVEKTPDNIAVAGPMQIEYRTYMTYMTNISYRELNEKSDRLARVLMEKGVQPGTIAAIKVRRSKEMIIGILGILKAGGAYLPIDPDYPEERINYMLADSGAKILLTGQEISKYFSPQASKIRPKGTSSHLHLSPWLNAPATSLAYIIYTSGSTGKPKGVLVEHRSVMNTLSALDRLYPFKESDVYLLKTSYTFDVSVTELFGWFFGGGKLALLEKHGEKNPDAILTAIEIFGVTHINFVPSMFNVFVNTLGQENTGKLSGLKYIFLAGEALLPDPVKKFRTLNSEVVLENIYGPTEAAVYASRYSLSDWDSRGNIPIGKPLPNVELYVLDRHGHLQPIGVPGELCISGCGVARGYLNRPVLTAERFDHDFWEYQDYQDGYHRSYRSHRSYKSHRSYLYRTGDLVRRHADGNIQYLGRIDHQVKIRGFRIEPGEIENRLLEIDYIKEAVVIAREDNAGEKNLCAYVVPGDGKTIDVPGLKDILSGVLPSYMVPLYVVVLEKVPLTPSGKVNRNALPEPVVEGRGEKYTAPETATEVKLVEIWSRVLGIERENIGIDRNFFELGGHSLKATVMSSGLYKEFNVKLTLGEIFRNHSIRKLAAIITASTGIGETLFRDIPRIPKREYYPLTYNQQRLYILHCLAPESPAYNLAGYMEILYEADHVLVEKVLAHIIQRHESLRTIFTTVDGHPQQVIVEEIDVPLEMIDLSMLESTERAQARENVYRDVAAKPFDLTRPLLFRSALVKLEPDHYQLMFNMHHIISDGWSLEILKQEFTQLYEANREGKELELPPLVVQYKDFAQWHNRQIQGPEGKISLRFWKHKLANGVPVLQLPADWERSGESTGACYQWRITKDLVQQIKKLSANHHMTMFTLMFTIYFLFLSRICNQKDIACSVIAAGRDYPSLQNIIGFFVNSVIIQTRVDEHQPFTGLLQAVNREMIDTFHHQSYPLEQVFDHLEIRYPEIPASFNMVNIGNNDLTGTIESFEPFHLEKVQDVKFHLEVYATEYTNGIEMSWVYKKNMFEPVTVHFMIQQYINLLEFFVKNPGQSFKDYLTKEKKQKSHRFKKLKGRTNHAGTEI